MATITIDEAADTATCFSGAELIVREEGGVTVTLFWVRTTDVLLERNDRALDVFHHPYAFAAARGIDTSPPAREPEVEVIDA